VPRRPRRNHSPAFKSKVALAAIKGDKTISELSQQFDVHPNQITQWKTQLLDRMSVVFEGSGKFRRSLTHEMASVNTSICTTKDGPTAFCDASLRERYNRECWY